MTTITRYSGKIIALAAVACAVGSTGYAEVVYDNSQTSVGYYYNAATEFGDQVNLSGTSRIVTDLKINYYLSANASGNETAEVRLYSNDGGSGAPGTLLYDSGSFNLVYNATSQGYSTINIDELSVPVGSSVTWTILFSGIDPIETAGVLFYDPPTVGSSYDDYWVKSADGSWHLNNFPGSDGQVANFGAQITAVPEPGTIALGLVGGLVWLGVAARRRKA
jgi:hypothetical protein